MIVSIEDDKNLFKRYRIKVLDEQKIVVEKYTTEKCVTLSGGEPGAHYTVKVSAIFEGMSSDDY